MSEQSRFQRPSRAERVRRSVQASKDSRIPTWAYALMLVAMVGGLYLVVVLFGRS